MNRRAAAGCAVVIVLATALGGCSSPSSAHRTSATRTVERTFSAYSASGDLTVTVADVAAGTCWTSSIAAPGSTAYRCIAGNSIYDPCFAPARRAQPLEVACVPAPWARAEVLRVPNLPAISPVGGGRPWALVLRNGARCVAATGTVPQVAGVVLGYECGRGMAAGLLPGSAAIRVADYGSATGNSLRRVNVTTIWRA